MHFFFLTFLLTYLLTNCRSEFDGGKYKASWEENKS